MLQHFLTYRASISKSIYVRAMCVVCGLLTVFFSVQQAPAQEPDGTPNEQTFVVTKTADTDDGVCNIDCSLREAIAAANNSSGNDTINFGVPGNFVLTLGQLVIVDNGSLRINSTNVSVTVSGNNASRVFLIYFFADVTINNVTIINGNGIGRGSKSKPVDIPLDGDPEISRRHLSLHFDRQGNFAVTNEGRNPAMINNYELQIGQRINVQPGVPIAVCSYLLRIQPK